MDTPLTPGSSLVLAHIAPTLTGTVRRIRWSPSLGRIVEVAVPGSVTGTHLISGDRLATCLAATPDAAPVAPAAAPQPLAA